MAIKDWSTTASTNATADAANGINFAEGQAPGSLNDSMRALMAVIKGDFANSLLSASGYQKFPNGLIVQWGATTITGGDLLVTFPIPFPNACVGVWANPYAPVPNSATLNGAIATDWNAASVVLRGRTVANGGTVALLAVDANWLAIGF